MTSIIKVNTFQDTNGNALFNSDGSGNVTLSAAAMKNTPAFFAKLSGNQTVSDNTQTLVNFDTEVYDTDGQYDTTNKRFVAPSAGKYVFTATAGFSNFDEPTGTRVHLQFYKNGSLEDFSGDMATVTNNASADPTMNFTTQMSLTTNDYVDVRIYQNGGSNETLQSAYARFFGYRIIGA